MKRILSLLLALALLLSAVPVPAAAWSPTYGECGDSLTWRFDAATSTLIITGTGKMYGFKEHDDTEDVWGEPPWGGLEIKYVRLGEGVENLGEYAFWGLNELVEFIVPERFTYIPAGAFGRCSALTEIELHEGMTSVGSQAFTNCTGLTEMVIPEGVTFIGYSAFENCTGLKRVALPSTLTNIGPDAFAGCTALTDVYYNGSGEQWDAVGGTGSLSNAAWHGIGISAPVAVIAETVSFDPPAISWTEVPGAEGYSVFRSNAKNGTYQQIAHVTGLAYTDLEAQRSRGYYYLVRAYDADTDTCSEGSNIVSCFFKTPRPTGNVCGDNLTWAFDEATGTLTVTGTGDMYDFVAVNEKYTYEECTPWGELPIRYVELHEGITSIGDGAFWGAEQLTGIHIPEGVTRLGEYAFKGCKALAYADLPQSLTDMGGFSLFTGCSALTEISIPAGVKKLGGCAFSNCTALESVQLSEGLETVAEHVFSGCVRLSRIQIPETVTKIGFSTFNGCKALTEVNLPAGLTSIQDYLFYGCENLLQIRIPTGVTTIEEYAFHKCSRMEAIWLPTTVTQVGVNAFYACDSMMDVWFAGNPANRNSITFKAGNLELENALWHYVYMGTLQAPEITFRNHTQNGKIRILWDSVPGGRHYEVSRATSPEGPYTVLSSKSTVGNYTNSTAEYGVEYFYRVRALATDVAEGSGYSNIVSGYRRLPKPVPKVSVPCSGENIVTWAAVAGAVGYEIWRGTSSTGDYTLLGTTGTELTFTDTTAQRNVNYYYKLIALHENPNSNSELSGYGYANGAARPEHSCGDWEQTAEPTVYEPGRKQRTCSVCGHVETETIPALPLAATAVKISGNTATGKPKISWDAVEGAKAYRVYRATSKSGTYTRIKSTSSLSYTDTTAKAGTNYYYKVTAVDPDDGRTSAFSKSLNRVCDLKQPVVTLKVDTASGKPKVTFEKISGAEKYYIVRATSKTGTYSKLATITGTTYIDKTAKAGKTYYYKVKALHAKDAADSAYSAITSRVCDLKKPVVTITRNSGGDPWIKWGAVSGAEGYEIYRATSKSGTYKLVKTTVSATSFADKNTAAGKTYYYKVMAIHENSAANSAFSAVKYIKAK